MSATPGKVLVDGVVEIDGERLFVLKLLQCRNPDWANRMFLARYDDTATWLDDLTPAFGEDEFFFEGWLRDLASRRRRTAHRARDLSHFPSRETKAS